MKQMMESFQKQWSSGAKSKSDVGWLSFSGLNAGFDFPSLHTKEHTNAGPTQGCLWPMAATRTFVHTFASAAINVGLLSSCSPDATLETRSIAFEDKALARWRQL
ncbi:hypothetical protein FPOA_04283 [Fusarium poae]|uniref:Uncharacterized protein n=1 Tax=Fusarium poae TaxID=36050 RepID=A0A1B8AT69_FUSPO|nr:hypothetical protein FPOA_04283 [Fusarium poae]